MYASKVIAALTVVGYATAASSATSTVAAVCSEATTIVSQADADALSSCTTFSADLTIGSGAPATITLPAGMQAIQGSLTANGAVNMSSLIGENINLISDKLDLEGLTILSELSFPSLKSVGTINFINLPELENLGFTAGVTSCPTITISDTPLGSIDGINIQTADNININNNGQLQNITFAIANITGQFEVQSNGQKLSVILPNLTTAGSLQIKNTTTLSIPALQTVNGTLQFLENFFTNISIPKLTSVMSGIAIDGNPSLSGISMGALTTTGGLQIENNTDLLSVNGFPKLTTIDGALEATGNFSTFQLPALKQVQGAFNVDSSGDINSDCDTFTSAVSSATLNVPAKVHCKGQDTNVQASGTVSSGSSSTGSSSSSSSTKKSAAGQLDVPITFGLIGGLLAMLV